jgi:hypothetical protein
MMPLVQLLVFLGAALLLAACGGGGEAPPTSTSPSEVTGTPRPALPAFLCTDTRDPLSQWNVQVTAKWHGDRIVIEGSANLPGPGTVNYWVCQDGQATASLQRSQNPEYKGGKIKAESKVVEGGAGPVFDPNAHFDVMLSILGQPIQMAYFTIKIPVEGKPD